MSKHKSLLPPNASKQLKAIEEAITPNLPIPNKTLWNPWTCPVDLLPWLASAMQVEDWDSSWSEETKRRSIAYSFLIHKHKGTRYAVDTALTSFGFDSVQLIEWFEDTDGKLVPGEFLVKISVEQTGIDEKLHSQLLNKISRIKNVRSHLKVVELELSSRGEFYFGSKCFSGETTEVRPWELEEIKVTNTCLFGSSLQDTDIITIYPQNTISITLSDAISMLTAIQSTDIVSINPGVN
ncbi:phage tail protein I [Vibrio parahaemolyticus]|uniref:phage tail protein I n=1 Tax=Vibrio parahaemolyticus TaxID=670 RepID=UPI00223F35AF|nr:phage tail protein I [Vibrio parahaemolyticus]MDL1992989.1 phage tail protein I [Vibrio parahaemolyticus]